MQFFINKFLSWSEVWALIIPLAFLIPKKPRPGYLKPVVIYLWIALLLNTFADIIDKYYDHLKQTTLLINNNYLYNIHSVTSVICFSIFFIRLRQPFLLITKKYLPVLFLIFVVINFQFEKFVGSQTISNRTFAVEAGILLFYCLQYYVYKLQEETVTKKNADFWVTTGLSIYVFFNFFFFLLYNGLSSHDQMYGWHFHNISYIILCIFIAKAFYVSDVTL